jgi:hypothetical protein
VTGESDGTGDSEEGVEDLEEELGGETVEGEVGHWGRLTLRCRCVEILCNYSTYRLTCQE